MTPDARPEAILRLCRRDPGADQRDQEEDRADVGGDVADPDPGGVVVRVAELLRVEPLGADPHDDVRGQSDEQQRAEREAAETRRIADTAGVSSAPAAAITAPTSSIAPEHVEEEREVPAVRPDVREEADHAPGFQTMRTRITRTSAVPATCSQNAREGP